VETHDRRADGGAVIGFLRPPPPCRQPVSPTLRWLRFRSRVVESGTPVQAYGRFGVVSMVEESWVPDACTLPSAERPLRVAEFDALFERALRSVERLDRRRLRLVVGGMWEAELRDLIARESSCCSFFTFTVVRDGGGLVVEIAVPPVHESVLDALAARLTRGSRH
jgi:hypothetical protein